MDHLGANIPLGQTGVESPNKYVALIKQFFGPLSGTLAYPPETRNKAAVLQFFMMMSSYFYYFSADWFCSNPYGIFFYPIYISTFFALPCSIYWTVAFYLSLRDIIPRMVKSKSKFGLFWITLMFFEASVLSIVMWLVALVVYYTDTWVCGLYEYACQGLLRGFFTFANVIFALMTIVLLQVKRKLGIGFKDSFGLSSTKKK